MPTLADKIAPYAAAFRRDGFVMVPDLLKADELERYGAAVDEAVARRKRFDNRKLGEKTPYEQSFIQCINLWEDTPAVRLAHVSSDCMRDGIAPARRRAPAAVARSGVI